jgi:hypothetical protein
MFKVVRIRRGWSYRIVYEIGPRWIEIHQIVPTWLEPAAGSDSGADDES